MARHARPRFHVLSRRKNRGLAVLAATVCSSLLLSTTPAIAQPDNPDDAAITTATTEVEQNASNVARLVTDVTRIEDEVAQLELEMGGLRERVNKALVDLHDAQASAEKARQDAKSAREDLENTQAEMEKAQAILDELSRSVYKQGAVNPSVTAVAGRANADDNLDRQTFVRITARKQQMIIEQLDRLRTEKANNESALRQARNVAEEREAQAAQAEIDARAAIDSSAEQLKIKAAERDKLVAEREAAQVRLDAARSTEGSLKQQRKEFEDYQAAKAEAEAREAAAQAAAVEQREAAAKAEQQRAEAAAAEAAAKKAAEGAQQAQVTQPAAEAETPQAPQEAAPAAGNAGEQQQRAAAEEQRKAELAAAQAADKAAAQRAEEEARKAAEEAARAEAEAKKKADDAAAAENARKAAQAAASLAAAALVAVASPEHTALANPYPTDEEAADALLAATANDETATAGDTNNQNSQQASATQTTQPTPSTTAETADEQSGQTQPFDSDALINLLDQIDLTQPTTMEKVTENASTVVTGSREEKIEAVINRAMGVLGTPYAWGGGNANGPTKGIRDGGVADSYGDYNKVGFDCSGLTLYAFAGVGIALPHYTGYQYQRGTKVNPKDMQRGDLIFYGPNAEYHVAIYLGDGTMIEAPQSGSTVKISPVRWGGMSPSVVRLI